jgi:recombination protein RecA
MAKKNKEQEVAADPNQDKDLRALMDSLNKGKNGFGFTLLSDRPRDIKRVTTGSSRIDYVMGGGVPLGRVVEIYGPESSGKTTLCLQIVAQFQKAGHRCAYIDAEQSVVPDYAAALGVDVNKVLFQQPSSGEQALAAALALSKSRAFGLIVIDSIAMLVPQAEIDGEMTDAHVGLQARMIGKGLRKLAGAVENAPDGGPTLLCINQVRTTIGGYGNPETTPGGKQLRHSGSIRMRLNRLSNKQTEGTEVVSNDVSVKCEKNKTAPPYRTATVRMRYGFGFDNIYDLAEDAIEVGVVERRGAWIYYNGEQIAQGSAKFQDLLRADPSLEQKIFQEVAEARAGGEIVEAPLTPEDDDS